MLLTSMVGPQVLATVAIEDPDQAAAKFYEVSRSVAENTLRWEELPPQIQPDLSALTESRDLFKVRCKGRVGK